MLPLLCRDGLCVLIRDLPDRKPDVYAGLSLQPACMHACMLEFQHAPNCMAALSVVYARCRALSALPHEHQWSPVKFLLGCREPGLPQVLSPL